MDDEVLVVVKVVKPVGAVCNFDVDPVVTVVAVGVGVVGDDVFDEAVISGTLGLRPNPPAVVVLGVVVALLFTPVVPPTPTPSEALTLSLPSSSLYFSPSFPPPHLHYSPDSHSA